MRTRAATSLAMTLAPCWRTWSQLWNRLTDRGTTLGSSCQAMAVGLALATAATSSGQQALPVHTASYGHQQAQKAVPLAAPAVEGQFLAPPPTGSVLGESSSFGIDGLALHFAPLTLKLPTLQLPSFFPIRNAAKMLIDPAQAPYQQRFSGQRPAAVPIMMLPHVPQQGSGATSQKSGQAAEQDTSGRVPSPGPVTQNRGLDQLPVPHLTGRPQDHHLDSHHLQYRLQHGEQQLALLRQEVASLAQAVRAMGNMAERTSMQNANFERHPLGAAVDWSRPTTSRPPTRHEAIQDHAQDHNLVTYLDRNCDGLRRLPPTRDAAHAQLQPVDSSSGLRVTELDHRDMRTAAKGSPPPTRSLRVWQLASALFGGVVIGAGIFWCRRAAPERSQTRRPVVYLLNHGHDSRVTL